MKAYSHLSAEERIRIDELRNRDGLGVRQIALRIGRDKATVSRELKRGCIASMFVGRVRQCFSVVWADGFPRCRHRFPVM